MTEYRLFWRALAVLFCPLTIFVICHKKFWLFWAIAVSLILLVFFTQILIVGYTFYCLDTYNEEEIRVVEDTDFLFFKSGHSESYSLNSKYYCAHRVLLIPNSKKVPLQYEFKGDIFVEVYSKNNKLLDSFNFKHPKKILREGIDDNFGDYSIYRGKNTSRSTSVFAFESAEIPFHWVGLKNMKVKLTVIKPDKDLLEFCDSATLAVIPDLRM